MGGSSGSGSTKTTIRYAAYIEENHAIFLDRMAAYTLSIAATSPFTGYTDVEVEDAFFGSGYTIASFPSLYDMYGKFMAGLDVEVIWRQDFEDTVDCAEVANLVSSEASRLDDDIEANVLPRFETGMRDMNAVMGSSFVVGRSLIEAERVKQIERFSAELKYRLIPVAQARWSDHLKWNQSTIQTYMEIMKLYYAAKQDIDETNYTMDVKDKLWPFTVMDFERAALGALQGATTQKSSVSGASTAAKAISGLMGGMAMGAQTGTPWGAAAGGALGLAASFL
jgi:hypothetical protein